MAEEFLRNLPRVEEADLPEGSECDVCREQYGSHPGAMDNAVRLPCQHVIGSFCISLWVSPFEQGKNTCPFCRYVLFPLNHDPQDPNYRELEGWYRASIQAPGMTEEDRRVARRSLRADERLLYEELQSGGSLLPALNEQGTLNAEQETALFEELVAVGAFEGLLGPMSDSNYRIVWELLRQDGFVYALNVPEMGGISGWKTVGQTPNSWFFVPSDEFAWPSGNGSLVGAPLV